MPATHASQPSSALQRAILQTITYFDLFDFAPTLTELERYLLRGSERNISLAELWHAVQTSPDLAMHNGFITVHDRPILATLRTKKYNATEKKRKRARRLLRWCAVMPGVRAVWLANSVAWGNAGANSDTDIVIVTASNKLWTARFMTTALLKLLRQRPGEQQRSKALCLSFYMSDHNLDMKSYALGPRDIHFAFWVSQMYPLYDAQTKNPAQGVYADFQKHNTWLADIFQNSPWAEPAEHFWITLSRMETVIKKILENIMSLLRAELWLKKLQMRIMPTPLREAAAHHRSVVISDTMLKLHTHDPREHLQRAWEDRCRAFT